MIYVIELNKGNDNKIGEYYFKKICTVTTNFLRDEYHNRFVCTLECTQGTRTCTLL